jgi:hypothetical protein
MGGQLTAESVLAVIGIVTAIFWCGVFIGTIWNKLARHDDILQAYGERLDDHEAEMKFMKGIR